MSQRFEKICLKMEEADQKMATRSVLSCWFPLRSPRGSRACIVPLSDWMTVVCSALVSIRRAVHPYPPPPPGRHVPRFLRPSSRVCRHGFMAPPFPALAPAPPLVRLRRAAPCVLLQDGRRLEPGRDLRRSVSREPPRLRGSPTADRNEDRTRGERTRDIGISPADTR